jgi:hypothetical protein
MHGIVRRKERYRGGETSGAHRNLGNRIATETFKIANKCRFVIGIAIHLTLLLWAIIDIWASAESITLASTHHTIF